MLAPFLAALALLAPAADQVTDHSVRLRWTTPAPAPTAVEYGTTGGYGLFAGGGAAGTSHELTLDGPAPATSYRVRALGGGELQVTTAPLAQCPSLFDRERALVRAARPGEPVYSWIEAASTSSQWCHGRGVEPQELRAETWMTLVNGATAIGWFTHSWTPDYSQFRVSAPLQTELRRTARQVTTLAAALLAVPVHVGVQTREGRVDAVERPYHGARYVFAANVSRTPDGTWHVYEEGRSVTAAGGSFSDAFAPLAVHVYVLPPAVFR